MANKKKVIQGGVDVQKSDGTSALVVDETSGAVTAGVSSGTATNVSHTVQGTRLTRFIIESPNNTSGASAVYFNSAASTRYSMFAGQGFTDSGAGADTFNINNAAGSTILSSTQAGAWTFGPASGLTGNHIVQGQAIAANALIRFNKTAVAGGATSSYFCSFGHGATDEGYIWHDSGGNMAFANASDARLKQNIREITGLDKCLALHPVMFDWKDGTGTDNLGFIAQEVETVLPKSVGIAPDGDTKMLSMQSEIIPILVKAIQELSAQVEELKAEVAILKAK